MSGTQILYGFFTEAGPKLDAFLDQITQKLGGKKFQSNQQVICIFSHPHRACHGAAYFLKKCLDSNLGDHKVVIAKANKADLIKDCQVLYKSAKNNQCLMTDDVLKELNDIETESEMIGDISLPSKQADIHIYKLTKFNDIALEELSDDQLFDYSNVAPAEPPQAEPKEEEQKPAIKSMSDEPLEISEVNLIYDYQKEQEVRQQQKGTTEKKEKTAIPSYASEQVEKSGEHKTPPVQKKSQTNPNAEENMQDEPSEQPQASTDGKLNMPNMDYDPPTPGIKGVFEDKKLLITLIGGVVSLGLIFYFAIGGGPVSSDEQEELTSQQTQPPEPVDTRPQITEDDIIPREKKPKKRVFTPILTEDEASSEQKPEKPIFPQEVGDDTAYLQVKSKPPGANVIINGAKLKGVTPMKTFLVYADTKLHIQITKPGYDMVEKTESIPAGQRRGFLFEMVPVE